MSPSDYADYVVLLNTYPGKLQLFINHLKEYRNYFCVHLPFSASEDCPEATWLEVELYSGKICLMNCHLSVTS